MNSIQTKICERLKTKPTVKDYFVDLIAAQDKLSIAVISEGIQDIDKKVTHQNFLSPINSKNKAKVRIIKSAFFTLSGQIINLSP